MSGMRQRMQTLIRCTALALAALVLALMPLGALAQGKPGGKHGLMWQRTGLPAVFPLQVKTHEGQNYYLLMTDAETGAAALAAYIEGGRFFQVLVPPGTFRVRFAIGQVWVNEEKLFGEGDLTEVVELAEPLTFAVRNYNTKGGHIVDLTVLPVPDSAQIGVTDMRVCQSLGLAAGPDRAWQPEHAAQAGQARLSDDPLYFPDPLTRQMLPRVELAQPRAEAQAKAGPPARLEVRPAQC